MIEERIEHLGKFDRLSGGTRPDDQIGDGIDDQEGWSNAGFEDLHEGGADHDADWGLGKLAKTVRNGGRRVKSDRDFTHAHIVRARQFDDFSSQRSERQLGAASLERADLFGHEAEMIIGLD